MSRSQWWGLPAAFQVPMTLRVFGNCSETDWMRLAKFQKIGGISTPISTLILMCQLTWQFGLVDFSPTLPDLMRAFSGSRRAKSCPWIHNSGYCWRLLGRPSNTRVSRLNGFPVPRQGCLSEFAAMIIFNVYY